MFRLLVLLRLAFFPGSPPFFLPLAIRPSLESPLKLLLICQSLLLPTPLIPFHQFPERSCIQIVGQVIHLSPGIFLGDHGSFLFAIRGSRWILASGEHVAGRFGISDERGGSQGIKGIDFESVGIGVVGQGGFYRIMNGKRNVRLRPLEMSIQGRRTTSSFPLVLLPLGEGRGAFLETAHGFDFLLAGVTLSLAFAGSATEDAGVGDTGFGVEGGRTMCGGKVFMSQAGVGGVVLKVVWDESGVGLVVVVDVVVV
jgi:hypothetical protein